MNKIEIEAYYYIDDETGTKVFNEELIREEFEFQLKKLKEFNEKKVLDMGRMKEVFMDICRHNDGELPEEITVADVARMKELEIYNWKLYEEELEKIKKENNDPKAEERQFIIQDKPNSNKPADWSSNCPF